MAVKSLCIWLRPLSLASPPIGTQSSRFPSHMRLLVYSACLCFFLSVQWTVIHLLKPSPCVLYPPLRSHAYIPQAGWPRHPLDSPIILSYRGVHITHIPLPGMCASITAQYLWALGGQGLVLRLNSAHPAPSPGHDTRRHSQVFVICCSRSQSYK